MPSGDLVECEEIEFCAAAGVSVAVIIGKGDRMGRTRVGAVNGTVTSTKATRSAPLGRFVFREAEVRQVMSPADVKTYLMEREFVDMSQIDQEELWVLLLNMKHRITHRVMVYRGTVASNHVRIPEVFKEAVRQNAPAIALAHNHPSGDATPSADDIKVTALITEFGRTFDIEVLDHVIIGDGCWTSLRERGLGNFHG